jgi:hypothetical protein
METLHHFWALIQEHKEVVGWIAGSSLFLFVATLIVIPILIINMPSDYFLHEKRHPEGWMEFHPLARWSLIILRSVVGVIFILVGISMLIMPGQGLLTIFIGLSLMTFPGKFAFERWVATRPPIEKALNWIRSKGGKDPLKH